MDRSGGVADRAREPSAGRGTRDAGSSPATSGSRSAGRPVAGTSSRPGSDGLEAAMQRAGRWLALRPRTRAELRERLISGGFSEEVTEAALARLTELRLIDDRAFARDWIEQRRRTKGLAAGALVAELEAKGVARDVVDSALAEVGLDDESQAVEVASNLLRKLIHRPLAQQGAALQAMLVRRGFAPEVAEKGARAVLPPEGWD